MNLSFWLQAIYTYRNFLKSFLGEDDPKTLLDEVFFLILHDQISVDCGMFCFWKYLGMGAGGYDM